MFAAFKPDAVVHLAARPGVRLSFVQPEAYTSINVLGPPRCSKLAVKAACGASCLHRRVPFMGIPAARHSARTRSFRSPSRSTPLPKLRARQWPLPIRTLTPFRWFACDLFTVYGPCQRPDLAIRKFAGMILEGKEVPIFGDGSLERDYTYIDDIVDGILRALHARGKFDIFNLGNSHPVRIDEMVDTLGRASGKAVRRKFISTPAGEMLLTHADLTAARQCLGYSPQVSFPEGIRRFAAWLKSHK